MKTIKYISIGIVILLVLSGIIFGTRNYKMNGNVTNIQGNTLEIKDECGEVWTYYNDDGMKYEIGDNVKIMINGKGTKSKVDDEIISINLD